MTLSLTFITRNSAAHIESLLRLARGFADEIVVAVDESSADDTVEICRGYADKLFPVRWLEETTSCDWLLAWLIEQCAGDWILRLDDDEVPSAALIEALPALMADPAYSHYWVRRRWLVGPNADRWLPEAPWWPDWKPKLFRSFPADQFVRRRASVWSGPPGDGRYLLKGQTYKLTHLLNSPAQLSLLANRWEQAFPGGIQWEQFMASSEAAVASLPDEPGDPPAWVPGSRPVPAGLRPPRADASTSSRGRRRESSPWGNRPGYQSGAFADLGRRVLLGRRRLTSFLRPNAEMRVPGSDPEHGDSLHGRIESAQSSTLDPRAPGTLSAGIKCLDLPPVMMAGQPIWLVLNVTNDGKVPWHRPGSSDAEVRISYHWLSSSGEVVVWDGLRAPVPHRTSPGQTAVVPICVLPPPSPGTYTLQWDVVIEGVAWFSQRGWAAPTQAVTVPRAERCLSARAAHHIASRFALDDDRLDRPDTREYEDRRVCPTEPELARARSAHGQGGRAGSRTPCVSVVMPMFNQARYLEEAVGSVLRQTLDDFELIIVDDGSTDESSSLLERLRASDRRIDLIRTRHQGVARALNQGIARARANLLARMDADDFSLPNRFEVQVAYLESHPECIAVGSRVTILDAEGHEFAPGGDDPRVRLTHEEIEVDLLRGGWPIVHPTLILRTEPARQSGGYLEDFPSAADHDFFLRLTERGRLANVRDVLLKYRRHPGSITVRQERISQRGGREAIRRAVVRRALLAESRARGPG